MFNIYIFYSNESIIIDRLRLEAQECSTAIVDALQSLSSPIPASTQSSASPSSPYGGGTLP